jgi:hypothetical protein
MGSGDVLGAQLFARVVATYDAQEVPRKTQAALAALPDRAVDQD